VSETEMCRKCGDPILVRAKQPLCPICSGAEAMVNGKPSPTCMEMLEGAKIRRMAEKLDREILSALPKGEPGDVLHQTKGWIKPLPDSGHREHFETGSVRDTREGKGRFDLIPVQSMRRLARHYEAGAAKYGDRNWERGQPLARYLDSAFRHLCGVLEDLRDEDHTAAVVWNMFAYMETRRRIEAGELPRELDDLGCAEEAAR